MLPRLSLGLATGMSKVHKCPACLRRVKRGPFLILRDRQTRREHRYHGAPHMVCLEAAAVEAERRGPDEVVLLFIHARSCADARSKLECAGRYFPLHDLQEGA